MKQRFYNTKLTIFYSIIALAVVVACFYYDYWVFKKIHPEAGFWLWVLDCLR